MGRAKHYEKYIYCLEGDWDNNLRKKSSVESALNLLEVNLEIETIYKTCSTKEEFYNRLHQLLKAPKRYEKYQIIYLAFHGFENGIKIGNGLEISLSELADEFEGLLKDKIIHFGSCSTLDIYEDEIINFIKRTKALGVSGYKNDIDFIPSTALDILYFELCQNYVDLRAIDQNMKLHYHDLCKKMQFKIYY